MTINAVAAFIAVALAALCGFGCVDHGLLIMSVVLVAIGRSVASEIYVNRRIGLEGTGFSIPALGFAALYLSVFFATDTAIASLAVLVTWAIMKILKPLSGKLSER